MNTNIFNKRVVKAESRVADLKKWPDFYLMKNLGTPYLIIEQRRKLGMLSPEFPNSQRAPSLVDW
jgi:hypothetical protein